MSFCVKIVYLLYIRKYKNVLIQLKTLHTFHLSSPVSLMMILPGPSKPHCFYSMLPCEEL